MVRDVPLCSFHSGRQNSNSNAISGTVEFNLK